MMTIQPGKTYRHFKGKLYKVHFIAKHSETLEDMVVYEACYENDLGKMWVRPIKMFFERVPSPQNKNETIPRFSLVE